MSAHSVPKPGSRQGLMARWQPAALVTGDVIAIKLTLGVIALVRAEDYAHGARDRYGILEAAFPLWAWSGTSYLVGACILAGVAWQRHGLVWLGHAIASWLYAMLGLATIGAAFDGWPPPPGQVQEFIPLTAWAGVGALFCVVLVVGAVTASGPLRPASWLAALLGVCTVIVTVALAHAPADGIRGAGPLLALALIHTILTLRTAPRPMGVDEGSVIEETKAPEGR